MLLACRFPFSLITRIATWTEHTWINSSFNAHILSLHNLFQSLGSFLLFSFLVFLLCCYCHADFCCCLNKENDSHHHNGYQYIRMCISMVLCKTERYLERKKVSLSALLLVQSCTSCGVFCNYGMVLMDVINDNCVSVCLPC